MYKQKNLSIQRLATPSKLCEVIDELPKIGRIKIAPNFYSYLNIDDNFIHKIYPLLNYPKLLKPDYFSKETDYIGAHISITYPEENVQLNQSEQDKSLTFKIEGLFTADLLDKRYFVLKVSAPDLIKIRYEYGLTEKLQLEGFFLEPHITVAVLNL